METCSICLDNILIRGKLSSCDHGFCFDCIHKWSEQTNTCPICKRRFTHLKRIEPELDNNKEEESSANRRGTKRKKEDVFEIPHRNQTPDDHFDPNDWWSSDESGSDEMDFFFMDPAFHVILMIHQLGPLIARHRTNIIDLTEDEQSDHYPPDPHFAFHHHIVNNFRHTDNNDTNQEGDDLDHTNNQQQQPHFVPDEGLGEDRPLPPARRARTNSTHNTHRGRQTDRQHHPTGREHSHSRTSQSRNQGNYERTRGRRHSHYNPHRSSRPNRTSQRYHINRRRRSTQRPTDSP